MSNYTTGELAKLAGVTVRTVQYYDTRGILIPSDFSEGGRRLYTEQDLSKLKLICFLRDIGIGINSIAEILETEHSQEVISLLLQQQKQTLETEIRQQRQQLDTIVALQKELQNVSLYSIENLNDIAYIMEQRKKRRKVLATMIAVGLVLDAAEVGTFVYAVMSGNWLPFFGALLLMLVASIPLLHYYYRYSVYICPQCHSVFKANVKEFIFANHTFRTRKLTCPGCGYKGFCVETYGE